MLFGQIGTEALNAVISMGAGLLGVGIGAGILKEKIRGMEVRIERHDLKFDIYEGKGQFGGESMFMRRSECARGMSEAQERGERRHEILAKDVESLIELGERHSEDIKSVKNFGIWYLTKKENMTLSEALSIIDGQQAL